MNANRHQPKNDVFRQALAASWLIKSSLLNDKSDDKSPKVRVAGALCVHKGGLLITATHGIVFNPYHSPRRNFYKVECRKYTESNFREAIFVGRVRSYGLSLFWVPGDDTHNFVRLEDHIQDLDLQVNQELFCFSHSRAGDFSFVQAKVCYPYPGPRGVVKLPPIEKNQEESGNDQEMKDETPYFRDDRDLLLGGSQSQTYRKVSNVVHSGDPMAFYVDRLDLELPLIQVIGFETGFETVFETGSASFSQCGCPVFKHVTGQLVGLFCYSKGCFQYLLPLSVVCRVVEHVMKAPSDQIRKPLPPFPSPPVSKDEFRAADYDESDDCYNDESDD